MHIIEQSELDGMPCPDTLIHGECLAAMKHIADGSIDMILCDLPYSVTQNRWDTLIPFEPLWEAYRRVIKPNGAIVLTASQPFTTALISSNLDDFKYCWVWEKACPTRFLDADFQPLKAHEDIAVFSGGAITWSGRKRKMSYYPQGLSVSGKLNRRGGAGKNYNKSCASNVQKFSGYPRTVLRFPQDSHRLHPTQKPVALFEYLVNTYTNPGDLVLDNTAGSMTTPVACLNTGRHFIGIELDDTYFAAGCARVRARETELALTLPY